MVAVMNLLVPKNARNLCLAEDLLAAQAGLCCVN